jgi:3-ketoacyl-CoA synthase
MIPAPHRPHDARRAKYELVHSVRTHLGNDDQAFQCMGNGTDMQGQEGIFLRKSVVAIAGKALRKHLAIVAPKILPMSEVVSPQLIAKEVLISPAGMVNRK